MRTKEQMNRELVEMNEFLSKGIPDSDISLMLTTLSTLVTYLASSASLVAESGLYYNQAKYKAFNGLTNAKDANGKAKPASLIKEYIQSKCSNEGFVYEFAQRLNAAITHTIEAVRTAISAEKSLNHSMSYSQTR